MGCLALQLIQLLVRKPSPRHLNSPINIHIQGVMKQINGCCTRFGTLIEDW